MLESSLILRESLLESRTETILCGLDWGGSATIKEMWVHSVGCPRQIEVGKEHKFVRVCIYGDISNLRNVSNLSSNRQSPWRSHTTCSLKLCTRDIDNHKDRARRN